MSCVIKGVRKQQPTNIGLTKVNQNHIIMLNRFWFDRFPQNPNDLNYFSKVAEQ